MIWQWCFWFLALTVCAAPFMPALHEWLVGSDAAPLVVVREQDTNIRHFAHSFFDQVQAFFEREGIDTLAPPPDKFHVAPGTAPLLRKDLLAPAGTGFDASTADTPLTTTLKSMLPAAIALDDVHANAAAVINVAMQWRMAMSRPHTVISAPSVMVDRSIWI